MTPKSLLPILGLFVLIACDGEASPKSVQPLVTSAPSANVASPTSQDIYQVVERVIQDPKVLRMDWAGMSKIFPAQCVKKGAEPELTCPPVEGILELAVLTSGAGLVDMVLTRPATCEDLYAVVAKRYGPGTLQGGDKCSADWSLNKFVKGAYIRLTKSRKQADKIFLQFAIEQGP